MYEKGLEYVDKYEYDKAITAFLEAGAWDEAGGLMEAYAKKYYDTGQIEKVRGWLAAMDETELKNRPALLILYGRILYHDFPQYDKAIELLVEAKRQYIKRKDLRGKFEAQVWQSVPYRMKGECKQSLAIVNAALDDFDRCKPGPWLYALALIYRGTTFLTMGKRSKVFSDYQELLPRY